MGGKSISAPLPPPGFDPPAKQPTNPTKIVNITTHIGLKEYRDSKGLTTDNLYDGHYDPTFAGTADEVVAYLESFLYLDSPDRESLKWEGSNGWFYQGAEAGKMLRAEIASLKDGSHSFFDLADS